MSGLEPDTRMYCCLAQLYQELGGPELTPEANHRQGWAQPGKATNCWQYLLAQRLNLVATDARTHKTVQEAGITSSDAQQPALHAHSTPQVHNTTETAPVHWRDASNKAKYPAT
jgi:hypothetical protein